MLRVPETFVAVVLLLVAITSCTDGQVQAPGPASAPANSGDVAVALREGFGFDFGPRLETCLDDQLFEVQLAAQGFGVLLDGQPLIPADQRGAVRTVLATCVTGRDFAEAIDKARFGAGNVNLACVEQTMTAANLNPAYEYFFDRGSLSPIDMDPIEIDEADTLFFGVFRQCVDRPS